MITMLQFKKKNMTERTHALAISNIVVLCNFGPIRGFICAI